MSTLKDFFTWFNPNIYSEWYQETTAGEFAVALVTRCEFLAQIDSNVLDFGATLSQQLEHFNEAVLKYGAPLWSVRIQQAQQNLYPNSQHRHIKAVTSDDLLIVLKTLYTRGYDIRFKENGSGTRIPTVANWDNVTLNSLLTDKEWLQFDFRNLSLDKFFVELDTLVQQTIEKYFASSDTTAFKMKSSKVNVSKLVLSNPLAALDLFIWNKLSPSSRSKAELARIFYRGTAFESIDEQPKKFDREIIKQLKQTLGIDLITTVFDSSTFNSTIRTLNTTVNAAGYPFYTIPLKLLKTI